MRDGDVAVIAASFTFLIIFSRTLTAKEAGSAQACAPTSKNKTRIA
jgi:hypothetical protein